MNKGKLNLTLDYDLIDYVKIYAQENRTTVSEIICQFILNLKRKKEREPIDIIISDVSAKARYCFFNQIIYLYFFLQLNLEQHLRILQL